MVCTGGVTQVKHHASCSRTPVERIAQGTIPQDTCELTSHFRLLSVSGHYACREDAFRGRVYHTPLFRHNLCLDRKWFVHKPCACNHMNAAFGRVGKCIPQHDPDFVYKHLAPFVRSLAQSIGRHPAVQYVDVYRNMSRKKYLRYEKAHKNLTRQGGQVYTDQSRINMFVKLEGISFDKNNPDCRAIQFRTPEYTLALAAALKRAEHMLYELTDVVGFGLGRLFAKNMNNVQRAEALLAKNHPGWHKIELDASRWDAHYNPTFNKLEALLTQLTCLSPDIVDLMKRQWLNRGSFRTRTQSGTFKAKYEVKGGRMSGDANTAFGNCAIMGCLLAAFGTWSKRNFTFLCDGDDSVFFHDGDVITDEEISAFFLQFGVVMAVENRPEAFEDIGFCQAKPVLVDGRWTMVRSVSKIMSKLGVSPKLAAGRAKYLRTVALGELSLLRGCPVLQAFLQAIIRNCEQNIKNKTQKHRIHKSALEDYFRLKSFIPKDWQVVKHRPVSDLSRASFQRAYGINIEQQLVLERALEGWAFDLGKTRDGEGIDVPNWLFPWLKPEEW